MKNSRMKLIQAAQAKILRNRTPRPRRETAAMERAESPTEEVKESPEYERREHGGSAPFKKSRSGSISSAGASVGGGT